MAPLLLGALWFPNALEQSVVLNLVRGIDLVQDIVRNLCDLRNLHRLEAPIRYSLKVGKLVVEPIYQGNSGVFLFAKELLDAFKCIAPVVMVGELEEQESLKKLAQVIAETEEWFVTVCCRCLIFALVDLVEKVVKLCDVLSEIRRHKQNIA